MESYETYQGQRYWLRYSRAEGTPWIEVDRDAWMAARHETGVDKGGFPDGDSFGYAIFKETAEGMIEAKCIDGQITRADVDPNLVGFSR